MISFADTTSAPLSGAPLDRRVDARTSLEDSQAAFSSVLGRAESSDKPPQERAREAAEQLVAVALVQPVLKQMRESSWAAPPFAPNQAERTFRGMMDAEFAQRLVKSGRWSLVDAVARRVLKDDGQTTAAEPRRPNG